MNYLFLMSVFFCVYILYFLVNITQVTAITKVDGIHEKKCSTHKIRSMRRLGDKLQLYQTLADAKESEEVKVTVTHINRLQQDIRVTLRVSGCSTKCTHHTPIRHIVLRPLENKSVTFHLHCKGCVSHPVSCNVEAWDDITLATIARRELRVHRGSTCECRGTCRCNCDENSPCVALDDTDMQDAGFVPISDSPQYFSFKSYFMTRPVLYLIEIIAALAILKAVIGFTCSNSVAIFGFNTMVKSFQPHPIQPFNDLPSRWTLLLMNIHLPLLAIPLFIHWIYCLLRQSCCQDTLIQSDCEHIIVKGKQLDWYEMSQLAGVDTSSEEEISFEENHSHDIDRSRTMRSKSERDMLQLRRNKRQASFPSQTEGHIAHLCASTSVYRHLDSPLGSVQLPMGTRYSVRGCFRQCENQAYAFNVPSPMYQYWARNESGWIPLPNGIPLKASDFTVVYKSSNKVLEEGEVLVTKVWPCINERK